MTIDDMMTVPGPVNISDPRREIELPKKLEDAAQRAISVLDQSGLTVDRLFEIFHEWRTRRTVASRRIFLTICAVVGGSYWISLDLSDASIWGLSLGEASLGRFLVLAVVLLLLSGSVFVVSRHIDVRVRSAKIGRTLEVIESSREAARTLEELVKALNLSSVEYLIDDFTDVFPQSGEQDAYDAIKFYENELEPTHRTHRMLDSLELIGIVLVASYTIYATINMIPVGI